MTDQTVKKTPAQVAKFKLEFMALMFMTGRDEEATQALKDAHEALDEIIASEADLGLHEVEADG